MSIGHERIDAVGVFHAGCAVANMNVDAQESGISIFIDSGHAGKAFFTAIAAGFCFGCRKLGGAETFALTTAHNT